MRKSGLIASILCAGLVLASCGQAATEPQTIPASSSVAETSSKAATSSEESASERAAEDNVVPVASDIETHKIFQTVTLNAEDVQEISIPAQQLVKMESTGIHKRKMGVIGNSLFVADDVSETVMLYQYNADTLQPIRKKEFPSARAIGFTDRSIIAIGSEEIIYYNENLEMMKTVAIETDSDLYQNDVTSRSAVVVDETHIAWFAHDRSVYVTDLATGMEIQIDPTGGIGKPKGLFHAIYPMNNPDKILIEGSISKESEDPSVPNEANDLYLIADVAQGTVEDIVYMMGLRQANAVFVPETAQAFTIADDLLVDRFSLDKMQETSSGWIAEHGLVSNFMVAPENATAYCILDLIGKKRYSIPEKSPHGFDYVAYCSKDSQSYFFLVDEDMKQANYLLKGFPCCYHKKRS